MKQNGKSEIRLEGIIGNLSLTVLRRSAAEKFFSLAEVLAKTPLPPEDGTNRTKRQAHTVFYGSVDSIPASRA